MGYSLHNQSKYDEAAYYYLRVLEIDKGNANIHENLIAVLVLADNFEAAVAAGKRALELSIESDSIRLYLAVACYRAGDLEAAVVHCRRARELNPKNAAVHRYFATLATAKGDFADAMGSYQKAIELEPNSIPSYLGLGRSYLHELSIRHTWKRPSRLESLAEAQNDNARLLSAYWDEGWSQYLLGRWKESIQASEAAIRIDDKNATLHFNLGLALLQLGEVDRARLEYDRGLAFNDAGELQRGAISDLEKALADNPDLGGARPILTFLKSEYARMTAEIREKALGTRTALACLGEWVPCACLIVASSIQSPRYYSVR